MKPNIKLDKDTFIKLMTFLKTWVRMAEIKSQRVADILWTKDMFATKNDLAYNFEYLFSDPESRDILTNIIAEAMNDTENEWINYYIYELDWGEKNNELKVYEADGVTEIPLRTLEDLYNILVNKRAVDDCEFDIE